MSWDEFAQKAKSSGYDGVEASIPFEENEKRELLGALSKHELFLIGQYYQSFEKDFEIHKKNFSKYLENIAVLKPLLIVSQTGKDYFSAEQNKALFGIAENIARQRNVVITHETHRNKALFAAHIAKKLLEENHDVKITADFSHWCAVSESLLEQQQDAVKLAISRTLHIHARVGHAQGAQVSDPRAKEWKAELETHLKWWDEIIKERSKSGAEILSITPEFGPAPYMSNIPFSDIPVADQWEINLYMLQLLKERYAEFCGTSSRWSIFS